MRRLRALALLLMLGASGGIHIAFSKLLGAETVAEALSYLSIYMAATSLTLLAAAQVRGAPGWRFSAVPVLVITGGFAYFAPLLIEILIAPRIDAALFAMVEGLEPAMATALAAAIALERATRRRLSAVAFAVLAGVLMYAPQATLPDSSGALWLAAAFLAPACYSIANVYLAANWPEGMSVLAVSAGEAFLGFLLGLIVALAAGVDGGMLVTAVQTKGVWLTALTAVSVVNAFLAVYLLRTESVVFVSFGGIIALATGVVAGMTIFAEQPTLLFWIACALTAASLWLLSEPETPETDPEADRPRAAPDP